jgi:hypothetical protein
MCEQLSVLKEEQKLINRKLRKLRKFQEHKIEGRVQDLLPGRLSEKLISCSHLPGLQVWWVL